MGSHTAVLYAPGPPELVVKHKTHTNIIQTGEDDDNNPNMEHNRNCFTDIHRYIRTMIDKKQLKYIRMGDTRDI